MGKKIDPTMFDLPPRTELEEIDSNEIIIVMTRKSRIIMAEGKKILDKARRIQKIRPDVTVTLRTTAPVCSRTRLFLENEGIRVQSG